MGIFQMRDEDRFCPIPYAERHLQTVEADFFAQVSDQKFHHLEGLCFDRDDNLYVCHPFNGGEVLRLDMETKEFTHVFNDEGLFPVAVKIHKDGRLFVCCVGNTKSGRILVMNPDGTDVKVIVEGYAVDDLVFDSKGGFYFTDYRGTIDNRIGGVYYVYPDYKTVEPVMKNLASPNGIALSKNEHVLWVTECDTNRLIRYILEKPGYQSVPYYFSGYAAPDSCCIDDEDNLYVAMFQQGRIMIFNPLGFPIGQVLLPNRDKGHNLVSTHPAIRPGTKELYICSCDDIGEEGANIFKSESFAMANTTSYQFR